jgi:hypothetical protein
LEKFFHEDHLQALPFIPVRKIAPLYARLLTTQDQLQLNQQVKTLEGKTKFKQGDYLARGIHNEEWIITKSYLSKHYIKTSGPDREGFCCYQATTTSKAYRVNTSFVLHKNNGMILKGKAQDYIVYGEDEAWVVDGTIFGQTYVPIDN